MLRLCRGSGTSVANQSIVPSTIKRFRRGCVQCRADKGPNHPNGELTSGSEEQRRGLDPTVALNVDANP